MSKNRLNSAADAASIQSKKARKYREQELQSWQQREQTREMKRAICRSSLRRIQDELLQDESLSECCFSTPKQRERKVRRIVEKRLAQAMHRAGRTWADGTRLTSRNLSVYGNRCIRTICAA